MSTPKSYVGIEPMAYQIVIFDPANQIISKGQSGSRKSAIEQAHKDLAACPLGSVACVSSAGSKPTNILRIDPECA